MLFAALAALISLLQGTLALLELPWTAINVLAATVALVTAILALLYLSTRDHRLAVPLCFLFIVQLLLFVMKLAALELPEVKENGARLAVVVFRSNSDYGEHEYASIWNQLIETMTEGLKGTGIPLLDLGKPLLEKHGNRDLFVHPTDFHPNELAHATAADEIVRFLDESEIVNVPKDSGK